MTRMLYVALVVERQAGTATVQSLEEDCRKGETTIPVAPKAVAAYLPRGSSWRYAGHGKSFLTKDGETMYPMYFYKKEGRKP